MPLYKCIYVYMYVYICMWNKPYCVGITSKRNLTTAGVVTRNQVVWQCMTCCLSLCIGAAYLYTHVYVYIYMYICIVKQAVFCRDYMQKNPDNGGCCDKNSSRVATHDVLWQRMTCCDKKWRVEKNEVFWQEIKCCDNVRRIVTR